MTGLSALWLPMLVSAILVFFASSVMHMLLPWHKTDYAKVPNEDGVLDALRPFAIAPGDYMLPRPAGPDDMKSEAFQAKVKAGPVMVITVPTIKANVDGLIYAMLTAGVFGWLWPR
jgi:hypothetical protein